MKLIVVGASGFVATEIIRQSLSIPEITSVLAVARRPVSAPSNLKQGADVAKLHSVVIESYGSYPDAVMMQLAGADACIWTVATKPSKSRGPKAKQMDFEAVRRVCQEYTMSGLKALFKAHDYAHDEDAPPFRYLYMSGAGTERDQTKKPSWMPEYCLMRGETENQILAFAAEHEGQLEACVAKPGIITAPGQYWKTVVAFVLYYVMSVPRIDVKEVSTAMLHQIIHGFEKEPLDSDDLLKISRRAVKEAK